MVTLTSSNALLTFVGFITSGIGVLLPVAFIVVIATVVRGHRPDAAPILLGAMIFECLISVVSYAALFALPDLVSVSAPSASGRSSFTEAYALSNLVFGLAHAMASSLLLWGIVRLAQPPSRQHNQQRP
jgi:hypothetical protein